MKKAKKAKRVTAAKAKKKFIKPVVTVKLISDTVVEAYASWAAWGSPAPASFGGT